MCLFSAKFINYWHNVKSEMIQKETSKKKNQHIRININIFVTESENMNHYISHTFRVIFTLINVNKSKVLYRLHFAIYIHI